MPDIATPLAEPISKSPFSDALGKMFDAPEPPAPKPPKPPVKEAPPDTAPKPDAVKPDAVKPDAPKGKVPDELFKKPEVAPDKSAIDDIAEPDHKGDAKGKSGWTKLKEEAKSWEKKATELEKNIAERKAAGKDTETLEVRLAEKEKQLAEYSELVSRARIETHPDFRREFIDGRATLVKRAQTIIDESGGDSKEVATALNLRGKARVDALREIAGELDNFQSGRLGRVIDELGDLDERASAKLEKSANTYAELQEQERQRDIDARAKFAKDVHLSFEDTTRRLKAELEVLNKAEGHDDWNSRAERVLKDAREFVETNTDLREFNEVVLRGKTQPIYRELFLEARTELEKRAAKITELESELKGIHSKSPSLASRGNGATGEKSSKPFSDAFAKFIEGA